MKYRSNQTKPVSISVLDAVAKDARLPSSCALALHPLQCVYEFVLPSHRWMEKAHDDQDKNFA